MSQAGGLTEVGAESLEDAGVEVVDVVDGCDDVEQEPQQDDRGIKGADPDRPEGVDSEQQDDNGTRHPNHSACTPGMRSGTHSRRIDRSSGRVTDYLGG